MGRKENEGPLQRNSRKPKTKSCASSRGGTKETKAIRGRRKEGRNRGREAENLEI